MFPTICWDGVSTGCASWFCKYRPRVRRSPAGVSTPEHVYLIVLHNVASIEMYREVQFVPDLQGRHHLDTFPVTAAQTLVNSLIRPRKFWQISPKKEVEGWGRSFPAWSHFWCCSYLFLPNCLFVHILNKNLPPQLVSLVLFPKH